jgi:hypothetical protein
MSRAFPLVAAVLALAAARADEPAKGITVDKDRRAVVVEAKVAPRKIDDPALKGVVYPIEVIACWPFPRGKKAHETVVTIDVKPSDVHKALEQLGLKPGKPVKGDVAETAQGPELNIFLEVPSDAGPRRVPIERTLVDPRSNKPLPKVKWRFTGSVLSKPSPDRAETVYGADLSGTLIAIFPVTDETVVQTSLTMKEEKYLKLETNKALLPKEGTPVKLVIEAAR